LLFLLFALVPFLVLGGSCPGLCQDNSLPCSSSYKSGLCPGPNNIECCEMATPNCPGQCQDNSLACSRYVSGLCPGGSNIQCCEGSGPTPPPPPPSNGTCAPFANAQWDCAEPSCGSKVCTGCGQPNYQCAEFVARTLASAGLIPLGPKDRQALYGAFHANGRTYDLLWVSSKNGGILGLEDYLKDSGWHACGSSNSCVSECSAMMVVGADGPYSHAVVGIAPQLCDAHNVARYHVSSSIYKINAVYNAPSNVLEIVARQREELLKMKPSDDEPYKEPVYLPY